MKRLHETTEEFIGLLQQVEKTRQVEPLVALFAEDAALLSPVLSQPLRGKEGARNFWRKHLALFRRVRSEMTEVLENSLDSGDNRRLLVVLEWQADAVLATGKPLSFQGISLVELVQGQVQSFRTYYDSLPLLRASLQRQDAYQQAG